jgi:hypothetical protein
MENEQLPTLVRDNLNDARGRETDQYRAAAPGAHGTG